MYSSLPNIQLGCEFCYEFGHGFFLKLLEISRSIDDSKVQSIINEQDYEEIGDCWDDSPGGEVCKEGKCETKNACPDGAPADAAVCNQAGWMGKNDNSYGADSVVTCACMPARRLW